MEQKEEKREMLRQKRMKREESYFWNVLYPAIISILTTIIVLYLLKVR